MLNLAPQILEWAKRQGMVMPAPTDTMEQPPEAPPAPPPAATVPPPAAADPLPDPRLGVMADYLRQYGPQQLAAAQEEDSRLRGVQGLAEGFNRAAMLIGRLPSQAQTPQVDSRVRDYLLRKQSAQEDMGLQGQMATLQAQTDPASRESIIARFAAQKSGHALPDNFSARDVASYVAAVKAGMEPTKAMAEVGKLGAETGKTIEETASIPGQRAKTAAETAQVREQTLSEPGKRALAAAETFAKQRANQQVSPEYVSQIAADLGVKLSPGMTYGEAKDRIDEALKARGLGIEEGKARLSQNEPVAKLRQEFQGTQTYKDTAALAESYKKIQAASSSGAGDISLVYGYMKLLDPTSSVREGEYATAANAGGAFDKVGSLYNRVMKGEKLPENLRAQFKSEAARLYAAQMERYKAHADQYRGLATKQGINPADVVLDVFDKPETAAADPLGIR